MLGGALPHRSAAAGPRANPSLKVSPPRCRRPRPDLRGFTSSPHPVTNTMVTWLSLARSDWLSCQPFMPGMPRSVSTDRTARREVGQRRLATGMPHHRPSLEVSTSSRARRLVVPTITDSPGADRGLGLHRRLRGRARWERDHDARPDPGMAVHPACRRAAARCRTPWRPQARALTPCGEEGFEDALHRFRRHRAAVLDDRGHGAVPLAGAGRMVPPAAWRRPR